MGIRDWFIDHNDACIYVYPLFGNSEHRPTDAEPGTRWTRTLEFDDEVVVRIEDAPPGMTYDAASKTLTWDVPSNQPRVKIIVLLNVVTPDNNETYKQVDVQVR